MLNLILSINYLSIFSGQLIAAFLWIIFFYLLKKNNFRLNFQNMNLNIYIRLLLVFTSWMIANSLIFSIDMQKSLNSTGKFALISTAGYLSIFMVLHSSNEIKISKNKSIYFLIFFNFIILMEHLYNYPITRGLRHSLGFNSQIAQPLDRVTTLFTITAPYLYMVTFRKNIPYLILLIVTLANYIIHPMNAASLAFMLGFMVMGLYKLIGEIFLKIYFYILGVILIIAPWLMEFFINSSWFQNILPKLQASWAHRIVIWQRAIELIKTRPLTGWGVNSSAVIDPIIPLHPHNFFLQIWLELGFIGINIVLMSLIPIYYAISKHKIREALLGSFTIFIIFASISFGIWQSWFLSALWIGLILYNTKLSQTYTKDELLVEDHIEK